MGRISKLLSLPPRRRWLLMKAAVLLCSVRICLWTLPFSNTRRLVRRASQYRPRLATEHTPLGHLAWAVELASRFVPGAGHCLTKAIAGQIFLMRRGHPARICYGVVREASNDFIAHAWLESAGAAVIGASDPGRYATLVPRESLD